MRCISHLRDIGGCGECRESDIWFGQVGRVGDVDLGDVPVKVALVVRDEPVGTDADGGGQVDRPQVEGGQNGGEYPDLVARP
jgi:hypothetical protein